MQDRPRSEQVASIFTRRPRGSRATLGSTPSNPSSTVASTPSPRSCTGRETPTPPSPMHNLSALVSAANPGAESSDNDDSPRDPTSIIGTPATVAAFVDRVANIFSLPKDNRSGLHSFSKVYVCPSILSSSNTILARFSGTGRRS